MCGRHLWTDDLNFTSCLCRASTSTRGTCARATVREGPCSRMELACPKKIRMIKVLARLRKEHQKDCGPVPIALGICVNLLLFG